MAEVVLGNVYDKYASTNPVARRLVGNYLRTLDALLEHIQPRRILEVGCGEGYLAQRVARAHSDRTVIGVDLSADLFPPRHEDSRTAFAVQSAYALGFPGGSFDLVLGAEVLEHLENPAAALQEMVRVSRRDLLLSVPREPLWRLLNLARGAYVRDWGNTPGHLQHWSSNGFLRFLEGFGTIREVRRPLPWTMVWLEKRDGAAPADRRNP
ncbi:MAG: hypothetical protein Kow00109_16140 [Acidobacteriota bacterium]